LIQIKVKLLLKKDPAFTFSKFDRVGGVGFSFDVFCVTEPFGFEWLALPSVAVFFD